MFTIIIIMSLLTAVSAMLSSSRLYLHTFVQIFFGIQIAMAVWTIMNVGTTHLGFFTFDHLGVSYYALMALVGLLCSLQSARYLDKENLRETKIYLVSLMLLSVTLTGVYLSNNIIVTWIFLEATTIATAGLTYHRRTLHSLEATWKYIFVSSVGIAIAYLGILLLSTITLGGESTDLSYASLSAALQSGAGNPIYVKAAFIFILVGYSSKFELFPLYTVGIDANHSAPTPASAFISSALVGGGFVAIYRVYKILQQTPAYTTWTQSVMLLVGLLSLLMAAVYLGRTRNLKRLGAYSTVEHSGLIAIGLGLGGLGIWAAVLHSLSHTIIKGALMLQLSVVGKIYGTYRTSRLGNYMRLDPLGGAVILLCFIALVALPPSILFRTQYLILAQIIASQYWWLDIIICILLLVTIYWLGTKLLPILYRPVDLRKPCADRRQPWLSALLLLLLAVTFAAGIWQAPQLVQLIDTIVAS